MKKRTKTRTFLRPRNLSLFFIPVLALSIGCRKGIIDNKDLRDFQQVNLVANNNGYGAPHIDGTLMNAWGLAWSPGGTPWVNSQAGHLSEVYDKDGATVRAAVAIPSPGDTIGGNPTGIVFNNTKGFLLSNGKAASFIFVGVDGVISGWNGTAGSGGNRALLVGNNSATSSYTGLTLAANGTRNLLYAANFRTGKIDVWDTTWTSVSLPFKDPGLPPGYSPFNIQSVGSWLFVAYAKVGPDGRDQAGEGLGFVDVFNPDGSWVKRFASRGTLNAPWGITQAPANFYVDPNDDNDNSGHGNSGHGSGDDNRGKGKDNDQTQPTILVGNFGNGYINAYTLDGQFLGQLRSHNRPIIIDGLWALSFAPATATTVDPNRLYFTAGPHKETDGVFGYLIKQ
ncbi:MAG TPA: TIGR03118 family protein [Puia sp.]|nr:TIGR03118 family protein [Puia sp.]